MPGRSQPGSSQPGGSHTGLEAKVALVTASAGPLAEACVHALRERGAAVALIEPDGAPPGELEVLVAILDATQVPTPATGGSADDDWEATVGGSARSLYRMVRSAAVAMSERGRGAIVVVAPEAGVAGVRGTSATAAAAGALFASARALAIEFAPLVRINTVAYGCIEGDPYSEWLRWPTRPHPGHRGHADAARAVWQTERGGHRRRLPRLRPRVVAAHQLVVDGGYLVH